jgi:DNA polymerase-3 subunit epsilon
MSSVKQKYFIFLDTETTGFDPKSDCIIELACVKVSQDLHVFDIQAEQIFHTYLKNDVDIRSDSIKIHGITSAFLMDKPVFAEIYHDFLNFIDDHTIIAHNANFDISFLNAALSKVGQGAITNHVIDSLAVARQLYPGSAVGIDALMKRFQMPARNLQTVLCYVSAKAGESVRR